MAASGTRARSMRARRFVAAMAALLMLSAVAGQPVLAGPRAPAAAPATPEQHPVRASQRPNGVERRGQVRVDRLPERSGAGPSPTADVTPAARTPASAEALDAGPPTDLATTSATTAPTLTKLPVETADANFPNPAVAVGPDHVAWSDDGMLTITNRNGGASSTKSFVDLFQLPDGVTNQQGQIYYDPRHGRWIAIEVSNDCFPGDGGTDTALYGHGYLDFAVSDTADPNGLWTIYWYTLFDAFVSNPGFGSSADKIQLTSEWMDLSSTCHPAGSINWDVTGIDWSGLLAGTWEESYFLFDTNDEGNAVWLAPAIRRDGASNDLLTLLQNYNYLTDAPETWLVRVKGSGQAATAALSLLPVPTITAPQAIAQPGGAFETHYGPTSVVAQDNRLVASNTEACTPPGDPLPRDCARIVDLNVSGASPVRRQDFFIAAIGKETYSPGAAFAENDDLVITYQQSTSAAGPTAYVVRQRPADALHTVSATATLVTSTDAYHNAGGPQHGAELVGLQPDPLLTDAVWVINQAGGTTSPFSYRVQVAQARTAVGSTYAGITPTRVLDSRPSGTGLTGPFNANTPRTFSVGGVGPIPTNAVAVTANVTVTQQTAAGYVSVTPTPNANPTSATINFPVGDNRGNNTTIPLGPGGKLSAVYKAPAGKTAHLIVDVTGYFLADDSGAKYHALDPKRILDSRPGKGIGLTGRFQANTPKAFTVWGTGGVPSTALAVTGNLSVVNQTQGGYITVLPVNDPSATASSLNFPVGDVRGNGLTARLDGQGRMFLTYKAGPGSTADLIFDVTGYYDADASGLRFYPLNPARIMDTRPGMLSQLHGKFSANTSRTLVTGGHFAVPGNAKAVTGNLTVVGQTQAGYIGITLTAVATPPVSSLNFPLGDVRGNGVTVPLNGSGNMVLIYKAGTGAKTDLVLDLTGYFR